jgi:hypothetical protein
MDVHERKLYNVTNPPSIHDQIAAVEECIEVFRRSFTHAFGEHDGGITDPDAIKEIKCLEAALQTLRRVAMGS